MNAGAKERIKTASEMMESLTGLLLCLKELATYKEDFGLAKGLNAAAELAGYITNDLEEVAA